MGFEKYNLDISMISGVAGETGTVFWHYPIAEASPAPRRIIFRLPSSYPSWMTIRHAHIGFGIFGTVTSLSLHHIDPITEVSNWASNEASWLESNIGIAWASPGVTLGTPIFSAVTRGINEDVYFSDGDILADIVAAQGGAPTNVIRGYILTCDTGYVDIDTIKNQATPLLNIELANPIIKNVTPLSDNSGFGFSFYVYVSSGEEPVLGFKFVDAYDGGATVATATTFSVQNVLSDGSIIYQVDMPAGIGNGTYYVALVTTSYEYRYPVVFTVGIDAFINVIGTKATSFSIANSVITANAAVTLLTGDLWNSIIHSTQTGNAHNLTAADLGADDIITALNASGTLALSVARLHADVMTATKHNLTSVTDHHDWFAAIAGFGVTSVGGFGVPVPLIGDVKLEGPAGYLSHDAINNSVVFDMGMTYHSANNWKVFYSNGAGAVIELALGAAGTYLQSNGAAIAPTFASIPAALHAMTNIAYHSAGAWKVFYSDGAQVQELALGAAGTVFMSNGAALAPSFGTMSSAPHTMTSATHSAGNWKLFYSNGAGTLVELALGAAGTVLTSNGAAIAPTFAAASSGTGTDKHAVRWNGTGVPTTQDSLVIIDDLGGLSVPSQLSVMGVPAVDAASHVFLGSTYPIDYIQRSSADATAPKTFYRKSRGTATVPVAVSNNDYIGWTTYQGYNGASWETVAQMLVKATEAYGASWGSAWYLNTVLTGGTTMGARIVVGGDGGVTVGDGTNGYFKVSGATKTAGAFDNGIVNPTNVNRLNYDGYLYATRVYSAIYNDLADFLPVSNRIISISYGRVYSMDSDGVAYLTSRRAQKSAIGIATDTYGYGLGQKKDDHEIPIAIAGFVLACVDNIYSPGTPLVCTRNGYLTKANWIDRIFLHERIIATFVRQEKYTVWNKVSVANRHWVKIR